MAKLPSAVDLGGAPSASSGRPIATYDSGAISRGMAAQASEIASSGAAFANGADALGKGVRSATNDVNASLIHEDAVNSKLESARARADFLTKKIDLDTSIKDDQDYSTLQERYNTKIQEIKAGSSGLISNPKTRELFDLSIQDDVAKAAQGAALQSNKIWKDQTLADSTQRLEGIRQAALKTTDPVERAKLIDSGNDIISSLAEKNITTAADAANYKKKWTQDYAVGAISMLPPAEQVNILQRAPSDRNAVLDRIAAVEGTGKNPASSATGDFQFTNGTWLATVRAHRPDLLQGRDEKTVLALRNDPKVAREMAGYLTDDNAAALQGRGISPSPGNLYLAHFLGADGAAKVLSAPAGTPVSDVVSPEAIAANRSILSGKTTGSVAAWSAQKMGDAGSGVKGGPVDFIPEDKRVDMLRSAQIQVGQAAAKTAMAQSEVYDRAITDASAGVGSLPPRASIESDPALDEPRRNTLLKQYDSAAGDVVKFERAITKFRDPNGGAFNPFDKEDSANTDKIYKVLGGNEAALQSVVQRTGIVPKSAVTEMRGGLASADPSKVQSSLQLAANLVAGDKPDAFTGTDGGKELSDAGLTFRHYVYDRGMSAADATRKIMEERTPEYEQKVKARIKSEDVTAIVKKELKPDDIRSAFDPSFLGLAPNPQLTFNPETRQRAMGDYEEVFRENFAKTGDVALSKSLAQDEMKKTWGVTNVNGSKVVMKYPPERSFAYNGIENPSEGIASQAIAGIKASNGVDVDRSKIRLDEVRNTGERYMNGVPPTYVLSYVDKNGHVQTIPKQFYADPALMRADQTAKRGAAAQAVMGRQSSFEQDLATQNAVLN